MHRVRRHSLWSRASAGLLAILVVSACATSRFDQLLARGDWTAAAKVFSEDSALQRNSRSLYRAALLHSAPGRDTFDPARARDLLAKVLEAKPRSSEREGALSLTALLDKMERDTQAAAEREADLQRRIDVLETDLESLRRELEELRSRVRADSERTVALQRAVDRLEGDIRERDERVRLLRLELERLKAIDLRPPERTTTPPDTLGGVVVAP